MDTPAPSGIITTHTAKDAFDKVLTYVGASLYRDEVDARYMEEAKTGTATYKGSTTKSPGIIDLVSDVKGYTEDNFETTTHPADFDSDNDGIPDEWEKANGLNPDDPTDALTYSLDSKGFYTNIEVYANSLVEHIMKAENTNAQESVEEYYPTCVSTAIRNVTDIPSELLKTEYFSPNGNKVCVPSKGIYLRKMTFKGNKVITDKVIR